MMPGDCEQIRDQLSAFGDGALDVARSAAVEAHLAECAECRTIHETLQALDASLERTLGPFGDRSLVIADRAVTRWQAELPATPPVARRNALRYLAAAAAGFLLAALLFAPASKPEQPVVTTPKVVAVPELIVARIVQATGPVQFKPAASTEWETVPPDKLMNFGCPSDSRLRTEAAAVCELSTADGCQVRLNEKTEVAWPAKDELQLIDGQVWCQTPQETSLRMTTAQETQWTCTSGSESLASVSGAGSVRVLAVSGEIDVTTKGTRHPLRSGLACESTNGEVSVRPSSEDFLLASRWMQPLLAREGHDNAELGRRVNAMLAQIGRTKISFLLEQDLRNLGEYGALPLLRFVQTADAEAERDRRQTAMRILTDTAPIWMVPDLIALLEDADPHIRGSAATALARLTRETQGLTADDWRGDRGRWAAGVSSWREWWTHHSVSCAPPPAGVSPRPNTAPPDLLKARNEGAAPQ